MTVKIREIREQPLLVPPSERPEYAVPRDVEDAILKGITANREVKDGWNVIRLHYYASRLGIPTVVTDGDMELARKEHHDVRYGNGKPWTTHAVGDYYIQVKALGWGLPVYTTDEERMRNTLDKDRKGNGYGLAETLYQFRALSLKEEVSGADEASMLSALEDSRLNRRGWGVLRMHYWLGELGIKEEITPHDKALFDERIIDVRGKDSVLMLAEAYCLRHELLANKSASKPAEASMPPLRRFTRFS